ncbi:hypothetical protein M514_11711 [Trichuris suis]|uniref:Uncharacterized protein n=1 Tax=Trichuris suis TaxID=68888 RepID=A0A085N449_9BILA|nr:hypothetical protein M514_11711 [Trichuris suis]
MLYFVVRSFRLRRAMHSEVNAKRRITVTPQRDVQVRIISVVIVRENQSTELLRQSSVVPGV